MKRATHVITTAERSQDEQLRARQIRYATMMGLRVLCLIVAAVLGMARVPLPWLWLPVCMLAMVLLPWAAVLIANDRPPKEQHRFPSFLRRSRSLPASAASPGPAAPGAQRVIEAEASGGHRER